MVEAATRTTNMLLTGMHREFFHGLVPPKPTPPREFYSPDFTIPFPHHRVAPELFAGLDVMLSESARDARGSYSFLMHAMQYRTIVRLASEYDGGMPAFEAANEFTAVYNLVVSQFSAKTGLKRGDSPHGLVPFTGGNATAWGPSIFDETTKWLVYECAPQSVENSTLLVATVKLDEPPKGKGLTKIIQRFQHEKKNKIGSLDDVLGREGFARDDGVLYHISTPYDVGVAFENFGSGGLKWSKQVGMFEESQAKEIAVRMRDALVESGLKGTLYFAAYLNYGGLLMIPQLGSERTFERSLNYGGAFYVCSTTDAGAVDNFGSHALTDISQKK